MILIAVFISLVYSSNVEESRLKNILSNDPINREMTKFQHPKLNLNEDCPPPESSFTDCTQGGRPTTDKPNYYACSADKQYTLVESCILYMNSCTFNEVIVTSGAPLHIKIPSYSKVEKKTSQIIYCNFTNCKGQNGAISITSSNTNADYLIEKNRFIKNYSSGIGGAISISASYSIIRENVFIDDIGVTYGDEIYFNAYQSGIKDENGYSLIIEKNVFVRSTNEDSSSSLIFLSTPDALDFSFNDNQIDIKEDVTDIYLFNSLPSITINPTFSQNYISREDETIIKHPDMKNIKFDFDFQKEFKYNSTEETVSSSENIESSESSENIESSESSENIESSESSENIESSESSESIESSESSENIESSESSENIESSESSENIESSESSENIESSESSENIESSESSEDSVSSDSSEPIESIPSSDPTEESNPFCLISNGDDVNFTLYNRCDYSIKEEATFYAYISDTNFTGIESDGDGSVIHIQNCGLNCYRSLFSRCTSKGCGGAVYVRNSKDLVNNIILDHLQFEHCSAVFGGAAYIYVRSQINEVIITACKFSFNTATGQKSKDGFFGGSSVFLTALNADVKNSTFSNGVGVGGSVKIYNVFNDESNLQVLNDKTNDILYKILITGCSFSNGDNMKSSIDFVSGIKRSQIEIENCEFNGKLDKGSYYIDEKLLASDMPKIKIKSCVFEIENPVKSEVFNSKVSTSNFFIDFIFSHLALLIGGAFFIIIGCIAAFFIFNNDKNDLQILDNIENN